MKFSQYFVIINLLRKIIKFMSHYQVLHQSQLFEILSHFIEIVKQNNEIFLNTFNGSERGKNVGQIQEIV